MSRPDIEGIRERYAKLATNCHSEQFIIGWAFEVVPALLDHIKRLELELSGYKRRDNKDFQRSLRSQ